MSEQHPVNGGMPTPRNGAPNGGTAMSVLPGLLDLVGLIQSLVRRAGRGDWWMPLLCLVTRPGTSTSPLIVLGQLLNQEKLNHGKRRVPYVRISATAGDLPFLLHEVAEGLAGQFGGPPLRFRRFALIEHLMKLDLSKVPVAKRPRELAWQLPGYRWLPGKETAAGHAWALPGPMRSLLAFVLPAVLLRPLLTVRMRWFMRQQYLAPSLSGDFLAFAMRLTAGAREAEDPEQIRRLLVHAFLEDLRVAYRRRPWRLAAWRRTAYPVLLLDDIDKRNTGYVLLSTVNAVRNETGRSDPLLVISNGVDVPPYGVELSDAPDGWVIPLAALEGPYRRWRDSVTVSRRVRENTTWYLPVAVPPVDLGVLQPRLPYLTPGPVPLLARPLVLVGLVAAVLLGSGTWYGPAAWGRYQAYQAHCYPVREPGRIDVALKNRECVGYSDSDGQVFGQSNKIVAIQKNIFKQNREAEHAWHDRANRPYITLVYLATLTRPDPIANRNDEETFVAEGEGLEGMAMAQRRANLEADLDPASPYLRVIVANAGQEAQYAEDVVGRLKHLVHNDPTVIGVVASVDSRHGPQKALKELDAIGLPTITPTTSADGIADGSNLYLQIASPNIDQAALVHQYVTQKLRRQDIVNYYTFGRKGKANEGDDLYVDTLRKDLKVTFGQHYQEKFWKNGTTVSDVCADTFKGVVFFGGRYTEFGPFLSQLYEDCSGRLPVLISDDSTSRYMVNATARRTAPSNFPLIFAAKGQLSSCSLLERATQSERTNFLNDIRARRFHCTDDDPASGDLVGGWIGLTYDSTRILVRAVKTIAGSRPEVATGHRWDPAQVNPQMVHQQAKLWTAQNPFQGVTGPIAFDRNGIVTNRYLSLLCTPNIQQSYSTAKDVPFEVDSVGAGYADASQPRDRPCK